MEKVKTVVLFNINLLWGKDLECLEYNSRSEK